MAVTDSHTKIQICYSIIIIIIIIIDTDSAIVIITIPSLFTLNIADIKPEFDIQRTVHRDVFL